MTAAGRQPRPGSPTGRSRAGRSCPWRAQSEAVSRRQGRRLCPGGAPSFRKVRAGPLSGGGKTRPGAQNLVTPRPLGPHVVLTPPTPFTPGLTLEVGKGLWVRAQCAQGPATLASGPCCLAHTHRSWRDRDTAPAGPGSLRRYTGRVFQGARASRSERSWGSAAKAEWRSWQPMKRTTSATESSSRKKSSR